VRTYARYATNSVLVLLFVLFAWANFSSWRESGSPTGLGLTILEAWTAGLFLVRRAPTTLSSNATAWVAAPLGSFAMLLARPASGGISHVLSELLQLAGVALALASLGALGRSFGLVAANRGIRTKGPYRLVRHPTYAGYFIAWIGYVAESPSARNWVLLALAAAAQVVRMNEEERVLANDASYRDYMSSVRRRLIPRVY
jgi:protein-S-isoprenylcysteine O-methyltransferase Ste14